MRIFLFFMTNIGILAVLTVVTYALGVDRYLTSQGINYETLLLFSAVMGFGGAFISLFISKFMAKLSTRAKVIENPQNETEAWLVATVKRFADKADIKMPEVAIYQGAPNAFATGPSRNNSLVAVSTGLLEIMNKEQAEAVIGHEVSHVANGDMVTLTLIQGVVNTFVYFLARVIGFFVDSFLRRGSGGQGGLGPGYLITVLIAQVVLGVFATMIVAWFSRKREFRADSGAAKLMGSPRAMIGALQRLGQMQAGELPKSVASSGINNRPGWMHLFSTHPPIEVRVQALSRQGSGWA